MWKNFIRAGMEILWSKRQSCCQRSKDVVALLRQAFWPIAQLSPAKLAPPTMLPCRRVITAASGRGILGTGGFLRIIKGFANNRP
jgi:hypothetical protein